MNAHVGPYKWTAPLSQQVTRLQPWGSIRQARELRKRRYQETYTYSVFIGVSDWRVYRAERLSNLS